MQTNDRVLELMKENGMDIENEVLIIDCQILYTTAQRDLLVEQREELKNGN